MVDSTTRKQATVMNITQMTATKRDIDYDKTDKTELPQEIPLQTFSDTNFSSLLGTEQNHITVTAIVSAEQRKAHCFNDAQEVELLAVIKPLQKHSSGSSQGNCSTLDSTTLKPTGKQPQYKQESLIQENNSFTLNGGLTIVQHEGQDVIVHTKIYNHFGEDCIPKIAKNQTVLRGNYHGQEDLKLESEQQISAFLKRSQNFKHLQNIEKLAEGGEAIVYKVNYVGFDEVVLKIPKAKLQTTEGFEDLICESQLIKCIYQEDFVVEVKEEIIEIDFETKRLMRYCVVVERARYSLYDLYSFQAKSNGIERTGLWFNKELSEKSQEKFSLQKYFYYFLQAMKTLQYLHSIGIIYADLKPQNLLVMRNQRVKIGDFGVSIITDDSKKYYRLKGLSPVWCLPEIRESFNSAKSNKNLQHFYTEAYHVSTLESNDIYGLGLAFSSELIKFLMPGNELSESELEMLDFLAPLADKLSLQRTLSLAGAIESMEHYLFSETSYLSSLMNQLVREKKYQGAFEIGKTLKAKVTASSVIASEQKAIFSIRISSILGKIHADQGQFQQAIQELCKVETETRSILPTVKSSEIKKELQSLAIQGGVMHAKCLINLGYLAQGNEKAEEVISRIEASPEFSKLYQYNKLDLQGQVEMNKAHYENAHQFFSQQLRLVVEDKSRDKIDSVLEICSYNNLGGVLQKMGQYGEALEHYMKAQERIIAERGYSDPQLLDCLKNIGSIYFHLKQHDQAEEHFNKALQTCQTLYGEQNVTTAETYRQIADVYNQSIDSTAYYYYQKAQNIFENLYGPNSIQTSLILNNLAGMYERQGDFEKAEQMCKKSLSIRLTHHGEESLDFATIYSNLAQIKLKQQEIASAIQYSKKAFEIKKKFQGVERQDTVQALLFYGRLVLATENFPLTSDLCAEAQQILTYRDQYGKSTIMNLMVFVGICQKKMGRQVECQTTLKEALALVNELDNPIFDKTKSEVLKELGSSLEECDDRTCLSYYLDALKLKSNIHDEIQLVQKIAFAECKVGMLKEGFEHLKCVEKLIEGIQGKVPPQLYSQYEGKMLPAIRELKSQCECLILNSKK